MAGPNEDAIGRMQAESRRTRVQRGLGLAGTTLLAVVALSGAGGGTASGQEPGSAAPTMDELMARGEEIYNDTCASCHQVSGMGLPGVYPPLIAGRAFQGPEALTRPLEERGFLKDGVIQLGPIENHIDIVLNGVPNTTMFPFRGLLSDADVAAVVTYERNAWGNESGDVIQPEQVQAAR